VDRLGERLRTGVIADDDLRALDDYRRSLNETYSSVVSTIQTKLELMPTGRPEKSTPSIIAKLKRQPTIKLSQMQDIAGCRIIVSDTLGQDSVVEKLGEIFSKKIKDLRLQPSSGYRAVHVVVEVSGRPIEVQVRTELQHMWAMASEQLSDAFDPQIKYGGGGNAHELLLEYSTSIQEIEDVEKSYLPFLRENPGLRQFTKVQAIQDINAMKQEIVLNLTRISGFAFGYKKGYEKGREELNDFLNRIRPATG
jgi:ppGpp synthetase/RelA/SpoT-type nucleotidyltranferase